MKVLTVIGKAIMCLVDTVVAQKVTKDEVATDIISPVLTSPYSSMTNPALFAPVIVKAGGEEF